MTASKEGKLNWLERNLPEGLLVDAAWLSGQGYSTSLRSQYVAAGWLEQPARRVYRRPRGKLAWQQVVISLQNLLDHPVVIGGRTAFELQGYAHYLPIGGDVREVHLYGERRLPGWIDALPLGQTFHFHNAGRLFPGESLEKAVKNLCDEFDRGEGSVAGITHGSLVRQSWGQWGWPLVQSTPERAILELMDELPNRESFDQVDVLMEGLTGLSPKRLQTLLRECRSIKVKRLFFWFADRHRHAWHKHVDRKSVDLGTGNRLIVRGGKLDRTYKITVPEDMHAGR